MKEIQGKREKRKREKGKREKKKKKKLKRQQKNRLLTGFLVRLIFFFFFGMVISVFKRFRLDFNFLTKISVTVTSK